MHKVDSDPPTLFVPTAVPTDANSNPITGFGLGFGGEKLSTELHVKLISKKRVGEAYPTWVGKVYYVNGEGTEALAWLTEYSTTPPDEKLVPPETEVEVIVCTDPTDPDTCTTVTVTMPAGDPPP